MEKKVLNTIKKYNLIEDGDRLVLGVSGGPDSISMLNIINKIKVEGIIRFDFVVAHINHGLRENAKIDEKFVQDFCKKINVKCFVLNANIKEVAKKEKKGLEETGRKIRYDFFNEVLKETNSNKIAIAHNANDNVETIIMNIIRGSGLSGLKGIEPINNIYIRPLIEIKREEIEEYCEKQKLNPRHDESNDENNYTRNKIRNIAIPYIKSELNPNIIDTITRLSLIVKDDIYYLDNQTEIAYNNICIEEIIDDNSINKIDYNNKEIEELTKCTLYNSMNRTNNTPNNSFVNNVEENNYSKNVYNYQKKAKIILDLKRFNNESKAIQKRLLLYTINKLFGSTFGIERIHIEDMIKLCNNNIGNKYLTPNKNTKIVIKNKKIIIERLK